MEALFKLIIAPVLFLTFIAASAQNTDTTVKVITPRNSNVSTNTTKIISSQEYVKIINGAGVLYRDSDKIPLTETYQCTNGASVTPDGRVTKGNDLPIQLHEGDIIFKNGHIKLAGTTDLPGQ